MKVEDLTLGQWQRFTELFKPINNNNAPISMRIDGTPLSVARFYGGFIYHGEKYTCFYFPEAIIGVRDDFLGWVVKELNHQKKG